MMQRAYLPATSVQSPTAVDRPKKILAVDDNEDILTIIRRFLGKQNYEIFTALNGREALEVARREMPDLILLDIMLPEVDGLAVCRELKQDPQTRRIMIILVTGRGTVDHRAEGLDAGADDYIPKPFHITELLARVRSALRIKRLNDELEERNRQLVESQRERLRAEKMATIGLLASGMAHEFNNIMSGISGYAQLARKNPKFRDRLVEIALIQSERAMELTRSLSSFYRPSTGKLPVQMETVIENALCLVAKEVEERRIQVEMRLSSRPLVLGSSGQLQEVILNLIINAVHAIGTDGKIEISLLESGDEVELEIKDNGCGIPPENQDRIFDAFFTTKGPLGGGTACGSGLGLSVSYNIIRAHGGSIEVKSEVGRGTTFTIKLPTFQESASQEQAAPPGESCPGILAEKESLRRKLSDPDSRKDMEPPCDSALVAEGEEAVREMVCQCLGAKEIAGAESWHEALSLLKKQAYEYIILDVDLPGSPEPSECLKLIRQIHSEAQVIFTSRRYPDGALQQALQMALGHLLKPYSIENLTGLMVRQSIPAL